MNTKRRRTARWVLPARSRQYSPMSLPPGGRGRGRPGGMRRCWTTPTARASAAASVTASAEHEATTARNVVPRPARARHPQLSPKPKESESILSVTAYLSMEGPMTRSGSDGPIPDVGQKVVEDAPRLCLILP